ncbi:pyruvate dehydrogenase (acetyl-transferring) E1 component subunit alpha [Puniceicoccales bacterium CK1056]|uniref:Pyruvate dehydrogenase E1 component subunit alpha n=2 Tax=Oceanipulchritudo coccoides TaxID=2706888 RepID=A0A6B2M4Z9_9BACT|nr:pyruvate dehydrogenase (acetyl-transferring) E1 component subunit alpha [Oceanipulchritudo coccoides]
MTSEAKIKCFTDMVRIRKFEQAALQAYQKGKMGGFLHLYIGQEATAVGTVSVMNENDHIITAYRDHGHALAVGMGMNECMAEMYGKFTGCSKGKGGSMHFFAPDKNFWGGHGIVAGQTPLGLGLAYALKYKGIKGCAICYLGDGAVNQGVFHESLNIASLWDVPIVYIIENNGYSMGTSQVRSSVFPDAGLASRAEAYKIDWDTVHGENLYEVRAKTHAAIERAHEKSRPTVMEVFTYRYYGHSIADANHQRYRTKEEIRHYQEKKDPLNVWEQILLEEKVISVEQVKEIDKAAKEEAKESVRFAEESPFPPPQEILSDVYHSVDNPGTHNNEGEIFFNDRLPF